MVVAPPPLARKKCKLLYSQIHLNFHYGKPIKYNIILLIRPYLFINCEIDHADVALEILRNHPSLAEARDDSGETALHVLARMPSAFATCKYQAGICSARIITSSN